MKMYTTIKIDDSTVSVLCVDSQRNTDALFADVTTCVKEFWSKMHLPSLEGDLERFLNEAKATGWAEKHDARLFVAEASSDKALTADLTMTVFYDGAAHFRVVNWYLKPCENVVLDKVAACEVSSDYEWNGWCDIVRYRLSAMLANAGMTDDVDYNEAGSAPAELLSDIVGDISQSINKYGCDEDWSIDEALNSFEPRIGEVLRMFKTGDHITAELDGDPVEGMVSEVDGDEIVVLIAGGTLICTRQQLKNAKIIE